MLTISEVAKGQEPGPKGRDGLREHHETALARGWGRGGTSMSAQLINIYYY